jgi:hypothetical protein
VVLTPAHPFDLLLAFVVVVVVLGLILQIRNDDGFHGRHLSDGVCAAEQDHQQQTGAPFSMNSNNGNNIGETTASSTVVEVFQHAIQRPR